MPIKYIKQSNKVAKNIIFVESPEMVQPQYVRQDQPQYVRQDQPQYVRQDQPQNVSRDPRIAWCDTTKSLIKSPDVQALMQVCAKFANL
jgi:hypothetical protein